PRAGEAGRPRLARHRHGRRIGSDAGTGAGRPTDRHRHGIRRGRRASPGGRALRGHGPHPHARRFRESERLQRRRHRPVCSRPRPGQSEL
ncbi:hypothetical protein LTR94_035351, partial [Friedmanniomyces endolithicus]